MTQANYNITDQTLPLCLLCFPVPKPSQMCYGHVEGRGMGVLIWTSSFLQPVCATHMVSMHADNTHVYVLKQGTFCAWRKHSLLTPFALRHLPQKNTVKWHVRIAKLGLGESRAVLTLHQAFLQHGCFPHTILIQSTWFLMFFFSCRCNLLCVSSSLLSCFLATYSNFQYLHEFATYQLLTHNSTETSNIFRKWCEAFGHQDCWGSWDWWGREAATT